MEALKREARKAWNRARRRGKDQYWTEYRKKQKEYKDGQEKLDEKSKQKFFEEANSIPAFARIHKILAKTRKRK